MCAAAGVVVGDLGVMLFGGEEKVRTVTPSTRVYCKENSECVYGDRVYESLSSGCI